MKPLFAHSYLRTALLAALPLAASVGCTHLSTDTRQSSNTEYTQPATAEQETSFTSISTLEADANEHDEMTATSEDNASMASQDSDTQTPTLDEDEFASQSLEQPALRVFRFGFDKSEISEQDFENLTAHAQYLIAHPDQRLRIQGHADNRGPKEYNQYLSAQRAKAIAAILIDEGVPQAQLQIEGMGDSQPVEDATQWAKNRRVELLYDDSMLVSHP